MTCPACNGPAIEEPACKVLRDGKWKVWVVRRCESQKRKRGSLKRCCDWREVRVVETEEGSGYHEMSLV